ncbi:hypothetical protein CY34DRAFT_75358, partial [Suillus luteus UH-Slu-Lm8-n1]
GHPGRSSTLNKLDISLHNSWRRYGTMSDLGEAIKLHASTLAHCYLGHFLDSSTSTTLPLALMTDLSSRFRHQCALADLDEATELHRVALPLRPSSRSLRFMSQQPCHQSSKNVSPHLTWMREAIELYRAAITLRPPDHLRRSAFLYHLAINLETRTEQ